MKTTGIIQARMNSTRLPGKVLMPIVGKSMLWHIVNRVGSVSLIDNVVVATSISKNDDKIEELAKKYGIACFRGSEEDVLDRFYKAAVYYDADPIIRITGDCPLADPKIIRDLIEKFNDGQYDHIGVAAGAGAIYLKGGRFPVGLDAECFTFKALEQAWQNAVSLEDREHVTPYLWRVEGRFRNATLKSKEDYSELRLVVDYQADLDLVRKIYEELYNDNEIFTSKDILRYLKQHKELISLNTNFIGEEGYQTIWQNKGSRPK